MDRPYIVVYNYKPGFAVTTGYIVSTDSLKVLDFLPKSRGVPSARSEMWDKTIGTRDFTFMIQCAMREKGFYSLKSLLCRAKFTRYVKIDGCMLLEA